MIASAKQPNTFTTAVAAYLSSWSLTFSTAAVFKSKATASSARISSTLNDDPGAAYFRKSGLRVVIRIEPLLPLGKNFEISNFGSSALSMIKSQWSLPDNQAMIESKFGSCLHVRAMLRNPSFAVSLVLASIQKIAQKLRLFMLAIDEQTKHNQFSQCPTPSDDLDTACIRGRSRAV
jgi:hypothetical protein